jgi:hypothetical protein
MSEFLLQLRWTGRFGNRMFQYAYGATYARLTGLDYWLPAEWEGTRLFQRQPHPVVPNQEIRQALSRADEGAAANQQRLAAVLEHFPDAELFDAELVPEPFARPGHPLCHANGCAYNSAIFAGMSRSHLQGVFEFSDEVKRLEAYKRYADLQGIYDVAHLRRDDISNPEYNRNHFQGYSVLSLESYRRAFRKFGYDEDAIEWVSDDYSGKWHVGRKFRHQGGWEYPVGSQYFPGLIFDWLADFRKLYFARTIFRANSSFSWWAATLSPTAKVFSPVIDQCKVYGVDGLEEIEVDFVEGNHPHYLYGGHYAKPSIVLAD